ncbi:MAG: hypothetical protein E7269_06050 [Lachnospiraceae bacterium]|nr:hypothetical protein [Lachnospiraceae bacterium]
MPLFTVNFKTSVERNTMDNQIYNFLTLLAKTIHKDYSSEVKNPVDWNRIFTYAQMHKVMALIFESAAKDEAFVAEPLYAYCKQVTKATVISQSRRTDEFLTLYRAFAEQGIEPVVVKGIVCRQLYGDYCDHRPSGDEDILIQKKDFKTVCRVFKERGYIARKNTNLNEKQLDEMKDISFDNPTNGGHVEVHLNLIGHANETRSKMNAFFDSAFENMIEIEVLGTKIKTLSHTEHFLYLVLHAFGHFIGGGVGIRQLLDILLYAKAYFELLDWRYIWQCIESVRADLFLEDLIFIGNQYMGFSLPQQGNPHCPEELLEDLISSGAFGKGTQENWIAGMVTDVAGRKAEGKMRAFKEVMRMIFLSRDNMQIRYPELREKPWLLPIAWVKRWIAFIKKSFRKDKNSAAEGIQIGKKRVELLKKYKVL